MCTCRLLNYSSSSSEKINLYNAEPWVQMCNITHLTKRFRSKQKVTHNNSFLIHWHIGIWKPLLKKSIQNIPFTQFNFFRAVNLSHKNAPIHVRVISDNFYHDSLATTLLNVKILKLLQLWAIKEIVNTPCSYDICSFLPCRSLTYKEKNAMQDIWRY